MYGDITDDDIEDYNGTLTFQEGGEYSFSAEAYYEGDRYWVSGEGNVTEVDDDIISAYSYYDGNVEMDYYISDDTLVVTLGEGFSGDEYIKTYEFEMVEDYNEDSNFQQLETLGISNEEVQNEVDIA